jgi:hypothetical protein
MKNTLKRGTQQKEQHQRNRDQHRPKKVQISCPLRANGGLLKNGQAAGSDHEECALMHQHKGKEVRGLSSVQSLLEEVWIDRDAIDHNVPITPPKTRKWDSGLREYSKTHSTCADQHWHADNKIRLK